MEIYMSKIRDLREDRDKTQEEIANYLGIKQTVYSRYETGRSQMSIKMLIRLCEYYKVSADYILGLPKGLPYGYSQTRG
nr:MAG TPA: helix-turn-helix domain protein [Inoviridae sp.]